ncbi:sensor histidine kinase [Sandaracinus amylolyticus]|uniref:sensor histidine kinase n=1 Tax=Sandaracinus amylolyticus TaxID=927083 RepID=UPI001F491D6F|nr:ATP-binding protein [Sandaracinus amylolyticus]UJR79613.1 Flagellar sensor histidine kinase FleS [Sandaracinus amylolyticus]
MKRARLTIPTRIFLAFASVLVAFGIVSGTSLVQHQRTSENLRLLHEAYVPLVMRIAEAQANGAVVNNMLEYVLDERESRRTRSWISAARQVGPRRLSQALTAVERVERLEGPEPDRATLASVRETLAQIQQAYERTDSLYGEFFAALDRDDRARAVELHAEIVRREAQIARQLLVTRNRVESRFEETSRSAAEQERRSVIEIAVLALLALLAGLGVTWWSQRLLAPLPKLQSRVVAVARGDLSTRLETGRDDEIGRLAQEFERMVDAIAARDREVRELQRIQERIVASLRSAVVVVDAEGRVRAANQSADPVLGIGRSAIDRPLDDTGLVERLAGLDDAIDRVAIGGEPVALQSATLTGDPPRHVDVRVSPFGTDAIAGRIPVLVVADDVTEELATKARLIQTERLAAMGKMAAHVTHEVRNPLSSIGLNVEVLADELSGAGPEVAAPLRAIQREIDRLTGITEEYLRLARLPAPLLTPEDLGAVATEVARFVERELAAAQCRIEMRVEPDLPLVAADEAQIRQALLNLIRNAREAMPQGGPVTLSVRRSDDRATHERGVEIAIADRGEGIPPERRGRVFDLFFSTKERGTGLGLSLTQQIVVAHRGHIRCEDGAEGGTTFVMWFPEHHAPTTERSAQPAVIDDRA